jgi:hypothetical protein
MTESDTTVQKALGHSTPTVTLNTCAHLCPTANDRTRIAAKWLFSWRSIH